MANVSKTAQVLGETIGTLKEQVQREMMLAAKYLTAENTGSVDAARRSVDNAQVQGKVLAMLQLTECFLQMDTVDVVQVQTYLQKQIAEVTAEIIQTLAYPSNGDGWQVEKHLTLSAKAIFVRTAQGALDKIASGD
jgi:hypothetical protein